MAGDKTKRVRYSGIQPQYFPRLHYFSRILNADIFMIRDDAQFVRKHKYPDGKNDKSYQAHTPIKQSYRIQFLSVPVKHKIERFSPIAKTEISYETQWDRDHLLTLKISYGKSKNFKTLFPKLEKLFETSYETIGDLNTASILWAILVLLEKEISSESLTINYINSLLKKQNKVRLKEIKLGTQSQALAFLQNPTANEKILALLQEVGANEDYCGGTGVAAYVDKEFFDKAGIKITVQNWKCQDYPQQFIKQQGFIPNLSILDLLFNVSSQQAREILYR